MVKRLIDEEGMDGIDSRLAALFRAAPRFEVDPFRKRRVLVSLERMQGRSLPRFWLRPAVVAALLVSGSAAAAMGHRYVTHGTGFFGFGPPVTSGTSTPSVQAGAASPRTRAAVAAPADPENAAPSSAPSVSDTPEAAEPPPNANHTMAKSKARPDASEDPSHVVEAIQALRTEGDPSRAQSLLNDYLKTHPHGVLSEDALALSIEAASAQHDPRAADYARRYLAKFPQGKYRDLATRALDKQH
jgi:hypothetical protein